MEPTENPSRPNSEADPSVTALPLSPSQADWARRKEIFLAACELPAEQRSAFLDQQCGEDAPLRQQVELLLAADEQARRFMAGATSEAASPKATTETGATAGPGGSGAALGWIGRYRLLQVIGEGGFGTVYKAEQELPMRRVVALKVIKAGMDTRAVIARFDAERQALAMMDHPNIARVFDAGETDNGRPYFVMELVDGVPLTHYCDDHRLTPRERLELFIPICQAVQHAHQKGIIHRDLKPSNVLVTLSDGQPLPKVIDFGIAKATQARLTGHTVLTELLQMIGTPQYMSPEQAEVGAEDIDTRSDIYSLGVMLYELLTGTTPLDPKEMQRRAYAEMQRYIREVDPPRPSARVSTLAGTESKIALQRRTVFRQLQSLLSGELDSVVMKCLEKDRARRYDTAAGLAADLSRYLLDEPVSAVAPSHLYRIHKYVRRHRTAMVVVAIVALSLIAGTAISTYGLVREAQQRKIADLRRDDADRQRAEAERQRSEADRQRSRAEARFADVRQLANDFMFKFDDALVNVAGATPARKMLADTASQYLDRLSRDAASDRSLSGELAKSYVKVGDILGSPELSNVGDTNQALVSYNKSLIICQKLIQDNPHDGDAQLELSQCYERIGSIQAARGNSGDALENQGKALQIRQQLLKDNPGNGKALRDLSVSYQMIGKVQAAKGQTDNAMTSYGRCLEIRQKLAGDHPHDEMVQRDLGLINESIGDLQSVTGRSDDALSTYTRCVELWTKLAGSDPTNATVRLNLAIDYLKVGDMQVRARANIAGGLTNYGKAVEVIEMLVHDDPRNATYQRDLSVSYFRIGAVQSAIGQTDDARASFGKALAIVQKLAADDPGNAVIQSDIANTYDRISGIDAAAGHLDAALANRRKSMEISEKLARDDPTNTTKQRVLTVGYDALANIDLEKGQIDEALEYFTKSLNISEKLARDDPANADRARDVTVSYHNIGDILALKGQTDEALKQYNKSLEICQKLARDDPGNVQRKIDLAACHDAIGRMEETRGQIGEASLSYGKCLQLMQEAAQANADDVEGQQNLCSSYESIARMQAACNQVDDAIKTCGECLRIMQGLVRKDPSDVRLSSQLARTYARVARLKLSQKDFAGALASVEDGEKLHTGSLFVESERANALLFCNRQKEAKEIYLRHIGEKIETTNKLWEEKILEDFADLEKRGITSPAMAEIRSALRMGKK